MGRGGFVGAAELAAGDVLALASGQQAQVVGGGWLAAGTPQQAQQGQELTTYNLEVEDFHTYFVGTEGVWVHNLCSAAVEAWASKFERQALW